MSQEFFFLFTLQIVVQFGIFHLVSHLSQMLIHHLIVGSRRCLGKRWWRCRLDMFSDFCLILSPETNCSLGNSCRRMRWRWCWLRGRRWWQLYCRSWQPCCYKWNLCFLYYNKLFKFKKSIYTFLLIKSVEHPHCFLNKPFDNILSIKR